MTELSTVLVHDSANDRVATITRDVAAFHNGGSDLEEEDIRKFAKDSDDAEAIHSLWEDARKERAAKAAEAEKAKAEVVKVASVDSAKAEGWGKRRSLGEEKPEGFFKNSETQPRIEEPKKLAEPVGEAEPVGPEREVEPAPEAMFRRERAKPDDDVPILSKAAPFDSAREFARRHCFQQGFLATYFWREDFWQWNGCHYERMPATRINDQVYAFLDRARTAGEGETVRFRPKPQDAEAVIKCLKAGLGLEGAPPRWLDADAGSGPKAENLLVFRNWLVDARRPIR